MWLLIVGAALAQDGDVDGVPDRADGCPQVAEDRDGAFDGDGCPDRDDDADDVPDTSDRCATSREDPDGWEDGDGCFDPDDDADGLPDATDACPRDAEDTDGVDDADGCPEPDRDRDLDGIADVRDRCASRAEDRDRVSPDDGCPEWRGARTPADRWLVAGGLALIGVGVGGLAGADLVEDRLVDPSVADEQVRGIAVMTNALTVSGTAAATIGGLAFGFGIGGRW